jgi:hypothetical protein
LEMTNPSQAPSMSYGMMTATRRSLKLSLLWDYLQDWKDW